LTPRRVRFTATAQRHLSREKDWWLQNRLERDLFTVEIEEAVRILSRLPGAGTRYREAGASALRRLYIRKLNCHLYYTFDQHEVIVRAVWGARRRYAPSIKS
jgi:plasmid stabilization system protein ParE